MTSLQTPLDRFDIEIEKLKQHYDRQAAQQFLRTAATKRREALRIFLETQHRLPATLQELVAAKIATQYIYYLDDGMGDLPNRGKSMSVSEFLERTSAVDDECARHNLNIHIGSVLALYLIRAVYEWAPKAPLGLPAPTQTWTKAAVEVLTNNGFTEKQLALIRSDVSVRLALAHLLKVVRS